MAFSIKFNGTELSEILDGFTGITRNIGSGWTNAMNAKLSIGSDFIKTYVNSKTITINFLVNAKSDGFSSVRKQLANVLNVKEPCPLIFGDEPNLVWYAIPDGDQTLDESNFFQATGTITFIVPDGIGHSTSTRGPFTATRGPDGRYSVTVTNEGNIDVPITMTATMNAENGYIGMYTDYGITEIGNKEENDKENFVSATTILNTSNFSEFTRYTGVNPENAEKGNTGTAGVVNENGTNYFHLSNAGTNNGYWHGASYVYDFPADGTGHVGAKNVYCYFNAVFWAGLMGQTGQFQVLFADANNHLVMGYDIYKNDTKGNSGVWTPLAGDGKGGVKQLRTIVFTTSHLDTDNPFNKPRGHCDIYKNGDILRYYWFGSYPKFTVPELKDVEITRCYINFYQYGARSGNQLMRYFDLRNMMIRNDSAEAIRNIKNRYQPKTKVKMTGANSKVYVNGLPKLSEKVDGSNLFTIPPGETTIYFQCSDWCTTPPTYQIEFSEANL